MEGRAKDASGAWLYAFRQQVNSDLGPLEFARNALKYDPYGPEGAVASEDSGDVRLGDELPDFGRPKCSRFEVRSVSSVFSLGKGALITCSDVRINLCKIYVYLTEAIARLRSFEDPESAALRDRYLAALESLAQRFNAYIRICVRLAEDVHQQPSTQHTQNEPAEQPNLLYSTKFREITSKFKVDQAELRRLFETEAEGAGSGDPGAHGCETATLEWAFYRDASCADIFALLCYALLSRNTLAYKTLLENAGDCMGGHLREHWKVLLSYVPIAFEFKDYQYAFESVLFGVGGDRDAADEALLLKFSDWCLWRVFLIVTQTDASYFLMIRLLSSLFKLLAPFKDAGAVGEKLQLLNFLKFIVKQYFIYRSFYAGGRRELAGAGAAGHMTFPEYLELEPSRKLNLFCEVDLKERDAECDCEEHYKDKHKIYRHCLMCKTASLSNKLKSFFVLISPANSGFSTPVTPFAAKQRVAPGRAPGNEYLDVSPEFRRFYESLLKSHASELDEYISGIAENFRELDERAFELLYSLLTVLAETGFRGQVLSIFANVVYAQGAAYNFLRSYFIVKSIFSLVDESPELGAQGQRVSTKNTLFALLRHFSSSNSTQITSSTHKRVCARLAGGREAEGDSVAADVLVDCIRCQLDFTEALLNLLTRINAEGRGVPEIGAAELVAALVSEEHFLLLLQKVLRFVVELALDPQEFYNCLYELLNLPLYISSVGAAEVHAMLFYTLALSGNLNYLNQELELWNQSTALSAAEGADRYAEFRTQTLDAALNTAWRMDELCGANLFHLLIAYCAFVPRNHRFYLAEASTSQLAIYSTITLYLNYMGCDEGWKACLGAEDREKAEMLATLGRIYKCLALFGKVKLVATARYRGLEYRFFERDELVRRALASVIAIINAGELLGRRPAPLEGDEDAPRDPAERRRAMLLLVFRCILEHAMSLREYTSEVFDNLKVAANELCPAEAAPTVLALLHALADPTEAANLELAQHFGAANPLNEVFTNLMAILYLGAYNLVFLSNLLQACVAAQLPKALTFAYRSLVNAGADSAPAYIRKLEDGGAPSATRHKAPLTELDVRELFNYTHTPDSEEYAYEPGDLRAAVMGAIESNRAEMSVVKASLGKISDKLGHNAASDFITAAIERAEGELLNIAKRTNKFDALRDRLLHRREHADERTLFPPVPNYFDAPEAAQAHFTDAASGLNELMQYRHISEVSVASLVPVDPEGACLMLMETCGFESNRAFLRELHEVFNRNDARHAGPFLAALLRHMAQCEWPEAVVAPVRQVAEFLALFERFPPNVTVLVAPFVFRRDYRLGVLKAAAPFVAANLEQVQTIYKKLQTLHEPAAGGASAAEAAGSLANVEEYLFGPLGEAAAPPGGDFWYMEEYVEVLLGVYEDIFLDDFEVAAFLQLEPLFLLNRDKYLAFLLKLYYALAFPSRPPTPASVLSARSAGSFHLFGSPRTPERGSRLNNARIVLVRRCICNFIAVYPELAPEFGALHRPDSRELVAVLEAVLAHVPELDLSTVDNFEAFKLTLLGALTLDNFFWVANAVERLDPEFAGAVYRRLELRLRPHSDELVDCTRLLFEYDLSNNAL